MLTIQKLGAFEDFTQKRGAFGEIRGSQFEKLGAFEDFAVFSLADPFSRPKSQETRAEVEHLAAVQAILYRPLSSFMSEYD
jgi:hypothetical protein